jgi:hypothetical protein
MCSDIEDLHMTGIEFIGAVASLLAVGEAGFLLGRRRSRIADAEANLANLSLVLSGITIEHVDIVPSELVPGEMLEIRTTIVNSTALEVPAWMGASLVDSAGHEAFEPRQDKAIVIRPGRYTYKRWLTIPPGSIGDHICFAGVWLGEPGTGTRSINLARARARNRVRVSAISRVSTT